MSPTPDHADLSANDPDRQLDMQYDLRPSEENYHRWLEIIDDGDDKRWNTLVIEHIRMLRTYIEQTFEVTLNLTEIKYLAKAVNTSLWQCVFFEDNARRRQEGAPIPHDPYINAQEIAFDYWYSDCMGFTSRQVEGFMSGASEQGFKWLFMRQRDALNNGGERMEA